MLGIRGPTDTFASAIRSLCLGFSILHGLRGLARRAVRQAAGRTREYVKIVRKALARETVRHEGDLDRSRCPAGRASRCGSPCTRCARNPGLPRRDRSEEPRADRRDRRRLAGRLFSPEHAGGCSARRGRPGARPGRTGRLRPLPDRPVVVGEDVRRAPPRSALRRAVRRRHGQQGQNFYNRLAVGWATSRADEVQDKYLAQHHRARPRPSPRADRPDLARRNRAERSATGFGVCEAGVDDAVRGVVRRVPRRAGRGAAHGRRGPGRAGLGD